MRPTNWLHRLCSRAPSFPRVQHCIKTGKAGLERLHSQAHCGEGVRENFGDSVSRLRRNSAVSAISQKGWSWTGVSWCCALFTPLFWSLAKTRRGAVSRVSCGWTPFHATPSAAMISNAVSQCREYVRVRLLFCASSTVVKQSQR